MKVVINSCFGGFSISKAAAQYMAERGHERAQKELQDSERPLNPTDPYDQIAIRYGKQQRDFHGLGYVDGMPDGYDRDDPLLVSAVEALGEAASGRCAALEVVEIPDGVEWQIEEYDGNEHVAKKHRTWP